jgi:peroxiredoxin
MFNFKKAGMIAAAAFLFVSPAMAAPAVGQAAPDFEAVDVNGDTFKLSDHKGKMVVLEWTNKDCPFVVKHYDSGNMQATQAFAKAEGAEWIVINSAAPGRQGHLTAEDAKKVASEKGSEPTTIILDESGEVGKMYDAQTTPHMYVIDAEGNLAYMGAIDDNSSPRIETVEGANNYVKAAITSLKAGEAVEVAQTPPYGCSVKYAD